MSSACPSIVLPRRCSPLGYPTRDQQRFATEDGDDLRPKTMIKTHAKTFDLDPKHWSAMAANRTTYIFTLASQDQMIAVSQGVSFDDDTRHVSATSHLEIWFPCPTLPNLFLCVLYPLCTFLVESMLQFRSWSITNYYIVYILI